jgi:hypothetical protein
VGYVKEAYFLLNGVSSDQLAEVLLNMGGWGVDYFIEERRGGRWMYAFFREVKRQDDYFLVKVGLREKDRWKWGEVFMVRLVEDGGGVRMVVRRVRGVGRIGSDLVGYWIVENARKHYPDVLLEEGKTF